MSLVVLGVGIPLTLLATALVRWFADLHRQWAAERLGEPVPRPYLPTPETGWPVQLWTILRDPATWRDWAWLVVNAVTGWFTSGLSLLFFLGGVFYLIFPLIYRLTPPQVFRTPLGEGFRLHSVTQSFALVPLGPVFLLLWSATAVRLANLNARVIRALIGPTEQARLRARVQHLATSRAETVDAQAAELRRIERDLHDGAQARLVALGMNLGWPRSCSTATRRPRSSCSPRPARPAASALAELRDLVRGIHPPVLADRGLDGAVRALALTLPLPVEVRRRPARPAAGAGRVGGLLRGRRGAGQRRQAQPARRRAWVRLRARRRPAADRWSRDDGRGGADPAAGSGLRGIERRLAAFDGTHDRGQPARRTDHRDHGAAVRVVIAEDLALLRDGLIRLLEAYDFEVVAAVDNGPALLPALLDAPARRRRRRRTAAADVHRRGAAAPRSRPAARSPACRCWCCRSTSSSSTPGSCCRPRAAASATCSRTGSPTSASSSTRCAGSPPAAPRWTPRSSPAAARRSAGTSRCDADPARTRGARR